MVSVRLSAAVAGAVLLLVFSPAAHAASARSTDIACDRAVAAADQARLDYEALKTGIERQIADGGHPDQSELQALRDADAQRVATASQAQRICGS
ncbi:hypothetical protein AB0C13_14075 [Streptomyces sp. NPDC049099]|uniref:hypothetical protein n=1 Tax=Streptomyces sp. NPDC049099 TaxID=3155768 RepID=UPI0034429E1C